MNFDGFKNYPDTTTPLDDNFLNGLLNLLLPIGKTEIFYDNEDHSNYMGFTWERTSIGKVPVGINTSDTDFNTIGKTGGEKKHLLTIDEMPAHNHSVGLSSGGSTSMSGLDWKVSSAYRQYKGTDIMQNQGGSQAHNNLQPYEVMAFWKRVA